MKKRKEIDQNEGEGTTNESESRKDNGWKSPITVKKSESSGHRQERGESKRDGNHFISLNESRGA